MRGNGVQCSGNCRFVKENKKIRGIEAEEIKMQRSGVKCSPVKIGKRNQKFKKGKLFMCQEKK